MIVKICGIQNVESGKQAAASGADFIGFVFADSSRQVTPELARQIVRGLPDHVKTVGVFVNEPINFVMQIANFVGLDYLQLHGDESPAYCKQLNRPVIKAFQVNGSEELNRICDYDVDYYLLDSPGGKYRGGSGHVFDWQVLLYLPREVHGRMILAGGLHADNVQTAIQEAKPVGVDVSSGVETNRIKDPEKIKSFVERAKNKEMSI